MASHNQARVLVWPAFSNSIVIYQKRMLNVLNGNVMHLEDVTSSCVGRTDSEKDFTGSGQPTFASETDRSLSALARLA